MSLTVSLITAVRNDKIVEFTILGTCRSLYLNLSQPSIDFIVHL